MFNNYKNNRCYIVAEIGGNFINFEQAKILVDAAKECGVDAVKLQTYVADTVASKKAMFDMENTGMMSQYDLFRKFQIDKSLHKQVFDYIDEKGLDWFSTPSHWTDVQMLNGLGVAAYKIGSDDGVNIPFLKYVAEQGKPVILATGMCTMQEVEESVNTILSTGNDKLILLHAVTSYPTHPEDVNLRAMVSMMNAFPGIPVGYSDHTFGITAAVCAAAMGARVIEKHFTCDKKADGPDHMLSADPSEMKEIVDRIREFEVMRGNGIKRPADSERTTRINNRKSIVINKPIKAGDAITKKHIDIKRPGTGIYPRYFDQILGRKVSKDLDTDDILMWEDLL
ncbi:MAG: N-acetylneuraminate synthase family protein [Bacteroidales bacterium]|jgi:N-acetylneuraminate synthase|nr:N-acetylneuraminate synthase family protein [Bacteroidales bacterium]